MRSHMQSMLRSQPNPLRLIHKSVIADQTLNAEDTGAVIDNSGATGTVVITLPTGPGEGVTFRFHVTAAYIMRITPGTSDGFFYDGSQQTDGYYIDLTRIGTWMEVTSDVDGNWVTQFQGTTQVQA